MQFFQKASIKQKQVLIILLTTSVALLLACSAFFTYDAVTFRRSMVEAHSTMAEMIGNNTAAALDFKDASSATETLSALKAVRDIEGACVYTADGQLLASYDRPDDGRNYIPMPFQRTGAVYKEGRLAIFQPIVRKGETLGFVQLESNTRALYERLDRYLVILVVVFALTLLVAFLISTRLQRVISEPILQLLQTTRAVAEREDYSVRVPSQTADEIGALIRGFNDMLSQIEKRDTALQEARDSLEKRVETRTRELARSLSLLTSTIESATDGIAAYDLSGRLICANSKIPEVWGISMEVLEKSTHAEIAQLVAQQVMNPEEFLGQIDQTKLGLEAETFTSFTLKDGRMFERQLRPQRMDETVVGRVIILHEITEQKRLEMEMEKTHSQLLLASRQAGMAEVATGVLHNVGNVLNSINVSTSVLGENLKKSKIGNVALLAGLIQKHQTDLATFITSDPAGKGIPEYVVRLAERLEQERTNMLKEIESVRQNFEHIRDIVAMQQNYAKCFGVAEKVKVTDLIEDALRMNARALLRHQVEVVREYGQNDSEINIEKHKVLQILVNLVSNAKYACDESSRPDKRMILRSTHSDGRVRIAVIDNGVGIPPENLTRIFNHGFTTRKTGHGFGLHSAILAAKEMGGSLTVQSDGPLCGAVFTLELPLTLPKVKDERNN